MCRYGRVSEGRRAWENTLRKSVGHTQAVMNSRSPFLPTTSPWPLDQIRAQRIAHSRRRRCSRYCLECRWLDAGKKWWARYALLERRSHEHEVDPKGR